MRIRKLEISGIGGIGELKLEFKDRWNVICGANGIGKTTILNTIADAFSFDDRILKKNALYDEGKYKIVYLNEGPEETIEMTIKSSSPSQKEQINLNRRNSEFIMTFNADRDIKYKKLGNIPTDNLKDGYDAGKTAVRGIGSEDMKGWFANRSLFSKQETGLSEELQSDFELAKKAFGLLDNTVSFNSIDPRSADIILDTPSGKIVFEYLSSGYKMCIYIVLGIIKEIELRFADRPFKAEKFNGVILIDEIDLHLHPTWQASLIRTLKNIFPAAQFICTTHSPSIMQSIEAHEVVALGKDENGKTVLKDLNLGPYGLQGWTLEEILTDVMEMPSTTSELYKSATDSFDKAMEEDDVAGVKENYAILDKMLHPNSVVRKLLQIQMAGMED